MDKEKETVELQIFIFRIIMKQQANIDIKGED
jgi:hypothetical protein